MTSGQCLYEMHPLTVWTAGQDRDTSRFKEKLLSGTAGRGSQTPQKTPDPVSWNGTLPRPNEVQHKSLDRGNNTAAALTVVTQLLWADSASQVRTAWMCVFSTVDKEREEARS